MAIPILNHLDLRGTAELQNALLHKTTTSSATNVEGKIIYDTGTNTLQYYNGSSWVNLTGTAATDAFKTISVSGQSNVVADSTTDTLTLVAAGGMTITTNASGDSITFNSANDNTTTTADVVSALNNDLGGDVTIGTQTNDTATFNGNITVGGNLTVNGTTTTVNSTTVTIDDPVFTLGGDSAPSADDNKDRGIEFRYYDSSAKLGFFGWDDNAAEFTFLKDATNTSEVFSGTKATVSVGGLKNTGTMSLGGTLVTSTAAELNILDGVTATTAELNILDGVSSTASELNILDGATVTTSEINLIDGGTARGTTAVVNGDGFLHNDGGTMRMTNVSKLADLFAGTNISSSSAVLSVSNASTSTRGVIEVATATETIGGTDTARAVTPDTLAEKTKVFDLVATSMSQANDYAAVLTHSFGTKDVLVTVYDAVTNQLVYTDVKARDEEDEVSTSKIQILCSSQPTNNLRAIVTTTKGANTSGTVAYGIN